MMGSSSRLMILGMIRMGNITAISSPMILVSFCQITLKLRLQLPPCGR